MFPARNMAGRKFGEEHAVMAGRKFRQPLAPTTMTDIASYHSLVAN
jgi:hypothetical protein